MCNKCNYDLIFRASKEEKAIERFLDAQLKILNEEWEKKSQETIKKALTAFKNEKNDKKGIEKFLAVLLAGLQNIISKSKIKEFKILTDGLYILLKESASKKFKIDFSLEKIDKGIVKAFGKDGPYWINNFYNTFLSNRISELSNKLLEKGYTQKELAIELGEMIESELALSGGSSYKSEVPKRFAGNIEYYNRLIASTASQRLKNFSDIVALYQGGYEVFVYTAIVDKRTCSRCISLNGKKFAVKTAYNKVEQAVDAENPGEFRDIMPWYNTLEEVKNLVDNEVPIPPIHGGCRCSIQAA